MAKYTIELGNLVKSGYAIFDDTWCTYVAEHKPLLESKIIGHYYYNEIGAETPDRFRHYINQHLREIMPYYNELYKTTLYDLAPIYNTIVSRSTTGKSVSSSSAQSVNRNDRESLRRMGESLAKEVKDDEWFTSNKTQHGVKYTTGNLTGNHTENENIHKVGTDDYTKNFDQTTDETSNRTINEVTNSKEVFDGEGTSKTTGNETESTTTSKWSSDTPQGRISNNQLSIDAQYLTNYEHTSGNRNRNYTENGETTTDNVTDFDKTVDTKDDFTRNETVKSTETFDEDTTETTTRDKTNKDIEDTTGHEDEVITSEQVDHKTTDNKEKSFADRSENEYIGATGASSNSGISENNDDVKTVEESTIGVSRANLIQQYRNAIINIDLMIIKELATDFMGVF